jgi:alkanesulfonate monooxygenase SsuD/methylene tetrahydromethanopterin reductase-like flavin-dependent oxidoreductase (luciferase family)
MQHPMPPIVVGGESSGALRRAIMMGNGWYGFGLTVEQTKQRIESLRRAEEQHERPPELGNLEITVTPVGVFDKRSVEAYAAAGVHRLVVLPRHEASHTKRHNRVPLDEILRNIGTVAKIVNGAIG